MTLIAPSDLTVSVASGADALVTRLLTLERRLTELPGLEPGPQVNALFTELVTLCCRTDVDAPAALADPRLQAVAPRLRQTAAVGEYQLERWWAGRISAGDAQLARFPYLANYQDLTRLELGALAGAGIGPEKLRRIGFLGGGPLPLSAILLARELGVPVEVVDRDAEAVVRARQVVDAVGVSGVVVHQGEAASFAGDCDLVVLAALVGADPREKDAVLRGVRAACAPGTALLARSARGLRTLLYPAVDPHRLPGFVPLCEVHPLTGVVNSVVVAQAG
jgi:nicotianamine synthase